MTIRDIAELAGVSVATVSRILNQKDANLSEETRARVLKVIEENDYVPYAKIRDRLLAKNNTVGLAIPTLSVAYYAKFAEKLQCVLQEKGYGLLLSCTESDVHKEEECLGYFIANKVTGIVCFPASKDSPFLQERIKEHAISTVLVDCNEKMVSCPQVSRNLEKATRNSVEMLLESGLTRIALLYCTASGMFVKKSMISGYTAALQKGGLAVDTNLIVPVHDNLEGTLNILINTGVDAVICEDSDTAGKIYTIVSKKYLTIPEDLSILALEDAALSQQLSPPLTAIKFDVAHLVENCVQALLCQIQKIDIPFLMHAEIGALQMRKSTVVQKSKAPKILIAGSFNMDIVLKIPAAPKLGETMLTTQYFCWPGGKGGNQAMGVSRFGGQAYSLGCLGKDRYGKEIYEQLRCANVHMEEVEFFESDPTGTAYIYVCPDGANSIVVNSGANVLFTQAYIERHADLFSKVSYCLLQMEIPFDAINLIAERCKKENVQIILKPSPVQSLPNKLLSDLFLLIPNEAELSLLCPEKATVLARAESFLQRGVKHVIVTLGAKGCLWVFEKGHLYFDAPKYESVDATGASDVFISCLAVLLSEKRSIEEAIPQALLAASFSVTIEGVQNSIIERYLLDRLNQENSIGLMKNKS